MFIFLRIERVYAAYLSNYVHVFGHYKFTWYRKNSHGLILPKSIGRMHSYTDLAEHLHAVLKL